MYLSMKPVPIDLKDFVGKTVFGIGQGNAWKRNKPLSENVTEFEVKSCAAKYATVNQVNSTYSQKIERRQGGGGSHNGGFNSSYLLFASAEEIEKFILAKEYSRKIADALNFNSTNMQVDIIIAMYETAVKAGWEPK